MDYYVIPRFAIPATPVTLHIKNQAALDAYRAVDIEEVARQIVSWLEKSRPRRGLMLPQIAR
jgi:hypothetical protein